MKSLEVPIVARTFSLVVSLLKTTKDLQKFDRHTIWEKCINLSIRFLEELIQIGSIQNRAEPLKKLSSKLDTLRLLIRASFECRAISQKKYIEIETLIVEIGKMLGGWIKAVSK